VTLFETVSLNNADQDKDSYYAACYQERGQVVHFRKRLKVSIPKNASTRPAQ